MKIQFTPQIRFDNCFLAREKSIQTISTQNNSYNPISYRDYNITFGKRLFRTPENFYEQEFNEQGMPKLLHKYIYETPDTDFRKTIPPAQAMQEVYGNINFARTLEGAKQLYQNEPLFADLHSKPSIKAKEGVLGELSLMKADSDYREKSLFKNGKDDLGLYILKKIYIEGKTLKEINKDFHSDISVAYKGLGDIKYSDLRAFGIHYPKGGFWKSFIATREDFPYVYIPRKTDGIQKSANEASRKSQTVLPAQKPHRKKFEDVKDWELEKITKTIEETNGGIDDIKKKVKKSGNSECTNFVSKYMSEIMFVTLDRLHASPEMKLFFEDYQNLSVSQRSKLKKYWENPDTKEVRSIVMKSTIQMFMDAYDEDGENEIFQSLLEYAKQIKPERLAAEQRHNKIQEEYDEMFRKLDMDVAVVENPPIIEEIDPAVARKFEFQNKLEEKAKANNAQIYSFKLSNGSTISIVANLREMLTDKLNKEFEFYPKLYRKHYVDYIMNNYSQDPKYLLSIFYNMGNLSDIYNIEIEGEDRTTLYEKEQEMLINEHLMSVEDTNNMTKAIRNEYRDKYPTQYSALQEALFELYMENPIPQSKIDSFINYKENQLILSDKNEDMSIDTIHKQAVEEIGSIMKKYKGSRAVSLKLGELNDGLQFAGLESKDVEDIINKKYNLYNSRLSDNDRRKISQQIVLTLLNYDEKNSILSDERSRRIFTAVKENLSNQKVRNALVKVFVELGSVPPERGDMKVFLQKDANKKVLMAKSELFLMDFINDNMSEIAPLLAMRKDILENVIRPVDEDLYRNLMLFRIKNGVFK